jgi:low temperature requirement protein LtrA
VHIQERVMLVPEPTVQSSVLMGEQASAGRVSALELFFDLVFRRSIHIPSSRMRLSMAPVSLLSIPIGLWAGGLAQIGALLLIFVVILAWEHAAAKKGV